MANTWTEYGIKEMMRVALNADAKPTGDAEFFLIGTNNTNLVRTAENWTGSTLEGQKLTTSGLNAPTLTLASANLTVRTDEAGDASQMETLIADVEFSGHTSDITAFGAVLVIDDKVWACFDFDGSVTVTVGGTLTLTGCELRLDIA